MPYVCGMNQMTLLILTTLLLVACGPTDKQLADIEAMEATLRENREAVKAGEAPLDSLLVLKLSRLQETWATSHPKDTLAPVLLFKAGQGAILLGDARRAYTLHAELLQQYPTHRLAGEALFQMATIAHIELAEAEAAQKLYKAYLSQFPNGPHARVAREAIHFFEVLPDSADAQLLARIKAQSKASR